MYQPDLIFQMTVSTSKDVNLAGLNVCLAGLRDKASQTLLLAVPETVYHKFTTVRLQPAMSVWPPTIKRYVLSIPIRAPASGSKRKASDLLVGVKTRVTKDAAFDDAMVDELVIGRTDAELAALAQDGVEPMKKKHKTWMRVGSYPTAAPQLDVYKRAGNGSFIYVPR